MISWLLQQALVTSCIIMALILLKRFAVKLTGLNGLYFFWALIPTSLLTSLLPVWQHEGGSRTRYVVFIKQNSEQLAEQLMSSSTLIIALWLTVGLGLFFLNLYHHHQYIKGLKLIAGARHQLALPAWLEDKIANTKLSIGFSQSMQGPLVFGLVRPQLVIPCDFVQRFDLIQRELIILHELQHYHRGDLIWNYLAQIFLTLFWFNPLSWIGYAQYRQCQELACDQAVLIDRSKSTRLAYAKALLLCQQQGKMISPTCLHYGVKNTMSERINLLKSPKLVSLKRLTLAASALLSAVLSINIAMAGANIGEKNDVYPIMRVEPRYPAAAVRDETQGSVVLSFDIQSDGSVENVSIVSSEPATVFDNAAQEALQQWRYETHGKTLHAQLVQLDFVLAGANEQPVENYDGSHERIKVTK